MIAAHLGAAMITVFAVPMAGVGLIQLTALLRGIGWVNDVGIFAILLVTSALSAWMFVLPGAMVLWGLARLGLRIPLAAPILGGVAGLILGLGGWPATGPLAIMVILGGIYGLSYQVILGLLWGAKAATTP